MRRNDFDTDSKPLGRKGARQLRYMENGEHMMARMPDILG